VNLGTLRYVATPLVTEDFNSAVCHDFNNDGWLDVLLTGDTVAPQLLLNQRSSSEFQFTNLENVSSENSQIIQGVVCADIDDVSLFWFILSIYFSLNCDLQGWGR
jgi:hypothetical protein